MTKYKAQVRKVTGKATHSIGTVGERLEPLPTSQFGRAVRVEIELDESKPSCYLIRYDAGNEFAGDTWHKNLDEAKAQAKWEYEIQPDDWIQVNDSTTGNE